MGVSIWGKYRGNVEKIDESSRDNGAAFLVREYQMAFGKDWKIWAGRKKDEPHDRESMTGR